MAKHPDDIIARIEASIVITGIATVTAKEVGVCISSVCAAAKRMGIDLRQGRRIWKKTREEIIADVSKSRNARRVSKERGDASHETVRAYAREAGVALNKKQQIPKERHKGIDATP